MDETTPTVAEEFAMVLALTLYRRGILSTADVQDMAGELKRRASDASGAEAERLDAAASLAESVIVEGAAGYATASEHRADKARQAFRIVPSSTDGGN